MKKIFTLILICFAFNASAQWSNTTNYFADSLHMSVSLAVQKQLSPVAIQSFPDSGFIFFWEDERNGVGNQDIYAQKYNKNGNRLWAENGVPVATGTGLQLFWDNFKNFAQGDYRNYSSACTDSAGGFYIAWDEVYQLGSFNRNRIVVQHVRSNGSVVFSNSGNIIAEPQEADNFNYVFPQLVADSRGGFFLSFIKSNSLGEDYIYLQNYKDEGGVLHLYASEIMNENVYQKSESSGHCSITHYYLQYSGPNVNDYHIWANGQGGCNIIMNMDASDGVENTGTQTMLAYNALWRAKKNSTTLTFKRTTDIADADSVITNYHKDSIYKLYNLQTFHWEDICKEGETVVVVGSDRIENFGLGYNIITDGAYGYYHAKGITLPTSGNINVNAIAAVERENINSTITDFITRLYALPEEVYDSIPYQRASSNVLYRAYNLFPPASMDVLQDFRDTILTTGKYYYDFSLAASAGRIHATALLWHNLPDPSEVYLQQLKVQRVSSNSFAVSYNTPVKGGVLIGKNVKTGFQTSEINYYNPSITTDLKGNALFHITEQGRYVRISPIDDGAKLRWGAMGKPIGLSATPGGDYVCMNAKNGTAVITWNDYKIPPNTDYNIYMRHLDSLGFPNYFPPQTLVRHLPAGSNFAYPNSLTGSSKKWSGFNALSNINSLTPVIEISDNYNLGVVQPSVYQNTTAIRMYNGEPYLDRNYTILPEHNPNGAATINVRLYFTKAEFDTLKAADAGITDPGSLVVLKQPNTTNNVPSEYTPTGSEEVIVPTSWAAVEGGYYLEIEVKSFSNFFIQKANGTLPLTWLGIQAEWFNKLQAKVSWQVAQQINVKDYTVQHSNDGRIFTDACTVLASAANQYNCIASANLDSKNYYRVMEQDADGKKMYSDVVLLNGASLSSLKIYPNPVNDKLYVNGLNDFTKFEITDAGGRLIQQSVITSKTNCIIVQQLKSGVYFLKLIGKEKPQTERFIKY